MDPYVLKSLMHDVVRLTGEHIVLVGVSSAIAVLIGVALGIIGTGLLAVPVLAGSAAYGVAEAFGWRATLEAKAPDAVGFYSIIAAATVIGFALGFTGIDAIHMLVWSAVLNGIVAVPIMAMMMVIVANPKLMGRFKARSWLVALGWLGTALMALAVLAMLASTAIG